MIEKNCFCFTCMKPVNLNGMVCEECFSSNWQCPDENDKDKLREWLDPWHPASEPPNKNGWYLVVVEFCGIRSMHIGAFSKENKYPFFSIGICADYELIVWRDLPPMPESSEI